MEGGTSLFIQKFIQSPLQIGSLFPSSAALAEKMTSNLNWENITKVAELGAGTGVITSSIVKNMLPGTKLHVFEKDSEMRKGLQMKFPEASFYEDACEIIKSIEDSEGTLDAVFSGLPFSNFNKSIRTKIVEEIYRSLRPGGILVAFQYSTQMKKTFQASFKGVDISFVPKNFPPAFVYICEK
ncbi:class I SAM-dependent methyltransferase [Fictibacillus halophilus]|uniref:class I SAM-dependent methyltransferase n=1 Tax=Fictibacillus halophilus TaxID=1610490 RepID=UPI00363F039A